MSQYLFFFFFIRFFDFSGQQIANVLALELVCLDGNHIVEDLDVFGVVLLAVRGDGLLKAVTVDLSVGIGESLEGGDHDFIFVGSSALLSLAEHVDELGEVDVSGAIGHHLIDLLVGEGDSYFVGSCPDVPSADDAVLIAVHELETFLELCYLFLGELVEDVASSSASLLLLLLLPGGGGRWVGSRHDVQLADL